MTLFSYIIYLDLKIVSAIFQFRSDFWDHFFLLVTWLGNWQVIAGLFILTSILFWFYKKRSLILPFFVAVAGSGIMTVLIKYIVGRERPSADIALYTEKLSSFPSAHAALISVFFGFLIYVTCRSSWNRTVKILISILLFLTIILIGFSRLYLGVHFLSDVLGGYLVGLLWMLIGVYLLRRRS